MSTKKQEFDITGMHCAACVKRVENVVSKVDGVASVKVNLLTRKGSVEFKDGATVEPQQIIDAITNIGFGATEADETKQEIEKVNLKPHITRHIIAASTSSTRFPSTSSGSCARKAPAAFSRRSSRESPA